MNTRNTIRPAFFIRKRLLAQFAALAFLATGGGSVFAEVTAPANKKPVGTFVPAGGSLLADKALKRLQAGNAHFVNDSSKRTNKHAQRRAEVAEKQKPFAIVVSCSDSRVGPEVVFDQGLGDLFVVRTAGHVVDDVGLASIEYAVEHLGPSLIVVLGHTSCGAIKGACDDVQLGHLTGLLARIMPAVKAVETRDADRSSKNYAFVEKVAERNVRMSVQEIRDTSPILKDMEDKGEIMIVGAMYDVASGKVTWYE